MSVHLGESNKFTPQKFKDNVFFSLYSFVGRMCVCFCAGTCCYKKYSNFFRLYKYTTQQPPVCYCSYKTYTRTYNDIPKFILSPINQPAITIQPQHRSHFMYVCIHNSNAGYRQRKRERERWNGIDLAHTPSHINTNTLKTMVGLICKFRKNNVLLYTFVIVVPAITLTFITVCLWQQLYQFHTFSRPIGRPYSIHS